MSIVITEVYNHCSSSLSIECFGFAPTMVFIGIPFSKRIMVGIDTTLYSPALIGFASTSSFATVNPNSFEISSRIGETFLHGPHHSAQKSTRTGVLLLSTTSSNVAAAVLIVAKYQYQAAFVADQEINLLAALTEIMVECKFK